MELLGSSSVKANRDVILTPSLKPRWDKIARFPSPPYCLKGEHSPLLYTSLIRALLCRVLEEAQDLSKDEQQ
jgi:hypothetical protein